MVLYGFQQLNDIAVEDLDFVATVINHEVDRELQDNLTRQSILQALY